MDNQKARIETIANILINIGNELKHEPDLPVDNLKSMVIKAINAENGNISKAANVLGINRRQIYRILK